MKFFFILIFIFGCIGFYLLCDNQEKLTKLVENDDQSNVQKSKSSQTTAKINQNESEAQIPKANDFNTSKKNGLEISMDEENTEADSEDESQYEAMADESEMAFMDTGAGEVYVSETNELYFQQNAEERSPASESKYRDE